MAAVVEVDESNLVGEVVESGITTGHYRGANDAPNLANPVDDAIDQGANSYEKWWRARWASGTASRLENFRIYQSVGAPGGSTSYLTSADAGTPSNPAYSTPVTTASVVAVNAMPSADPGNKQIEGTLNAIAERTGYVVQQVQVGGGETVSNQTGEITLAWREIA